MKFNSKLLLILILTVAIIFIFSCDDEAAPPDLQDTEIVENTAPSGTAGIGKTVLVGEIAIFEGSAADADAGDTLTYLWSITSVPVGSSITNADIIDASTLNASFVPDVAGEYTVQLTVSDGTDSITAEATVRAVGFLFGLNNILGTAAAYIHNGEFAQLNTPLSSIAGFYQTESFLYQGTVYTNGASAYNSNPMVNPPLLSYQPVYWTDTAPTEVDLPVEYSNCEAESIALESDGDIQLTVKNIGGSTLFYWLEDYGYIDASVAISSDGPGIYHTVTDLFLNGNDIFQVGTSWDDFQNQYYFIAKNRTAVVPDADYSAAPPYSSNFEVKGTLLKPGASDADTLLYIYGNFNKGAASSSIYAGYVGNGGSWVDLYHSTTYPDSSAQYVVCMDSLEDYILHIPDESSDYTEVYVDGTKAVMEVPYAGDSDVMISSLEHMYIEIIDDSVFVAGGYHYSDISEKSYNVAAVWRDGIIVYEGYDDDPFDGMDYDNAAIVSADFE